MRVLKAAVLTLVITATVVGCNSGSSPTAPAAQTINIAGPWDGIWTVEGVPFFLTMLLNQSANSTAVDGSMTLVDITFPIRGTTTFATATTGTFEWEGVDGGCGSFEGAFDIVDLTTLSGSAELSTIGCEDPGLLAGPMEFTKVGAAAPVIESIGPRSGFEDLVREMGDRP
jgi:hypothetical protein